MAAHPVQPGRKPEWLRVKLPPARAFRQTEELLRDLRLHTVCQEARCPNKGECFSAGTATFLILGDECTRDCWFCAVRHNAHPLPVDPDEPRRLAAAVVRMHLRHVVVTSVTRDDLPDGGASHFGAVVETVRQAAPHVTIEVLIPDLRGDPVALKTVLDASPDVLNHNVETVPRLYPTVRPQADYGRSLAVLQRAATRGGSVVKTGLMVGLGETEAEIDAVLRDSASVGVQVVTMGQYLSPGPGRAPVARYVPPDELQSWAARGDELGLKVVAGPFVRSSYRAAEVLAEVRAQN